MTRQDKHRSPEVELKLRFPAEAGDAIERHPALLPPGATAPKRHHLVSTYFDTPGYALAEAGFSLRLRRNGSLRVQTLKSRADGGAAAASRGEWEWPVKQDAPDLALLAETPAAGLVYPGMAGDLQPVLTTDIHRTVWQVSLQGGAVVEAARDEGRLLAGDKAQPVHELELELKEGPVGPLYELALALHADLPLHIEAAAKADRGARLRTGRPPEPVKAAAPALDRHAGATEGWQRMMGAALDGLISNQAPAASGDAEGVHQMRVAMRRLRAILVLFKPELEPHATARFTQELRRLSQVLGEARDWDVFCTETLPAALEGAERESWRQLLGDAAAAERGAAHGRVREEFARPALTGLILALAAWAENASDALSGPAMRQRLPDLVPELLDRVARKLLRRGRHVARLHGPELHAVRKSLKKLRYGVDYAAALYDEEQVKPYLKRCKALQKLLGQVNDAAVAVALADRLGQDGHLHLVPAIGALAHWSEQRHAKALRDLPDAWSDFRKAPAFWR